MSRRQREKNGKMATNKGIRRVVVVLLSVILLISIVTVIIIFSRKRPEEHVLTAPENLHLQPQIPVCKDALCYLKTKSLYKYSNFSIDPCQDFYEYSCSNFDLEKITSEEGEFRDDWTPRSRLGKWALLQMHRMLEDKNIVTRINSRAFNQAAQYYKACLMKLTDTRTGSEKQTAFQGLVNLFHGLVSEWREEYGHVEYILGILALYDINVLVKAKSVYSPFKRRNVVSLDAGELIYKGSYQHVQHLFHTDKETYMKHLSDASKLVEEAGVMGEEIWELEKSLFQISYNPFTSTPYANNSGFFTVSEVQHFVGNSINVTAYMYEVFDRPVDGQEVVILKNINYFKKLPSVLSRHSRKVLFQFVKWHFARGVSRFIPSHFSEYLSFIDNDASLLSRDCLSSTMDIFGYAAGILYARERRISLIDHHLITDIFDGLKKTVIELIDSRTWLVKDEYKKEIKNKLHDLKHVIIAEERDADVADLDNYYSEFSVKRNQLANFLEGKVVSKKRSRLYNWLVNPVDAYSLYNPNTNAIEVPLGLLQSPVFQSVYPKSVLLGTIGSKLGRQISRSMDEFKLSDFDRENDCYSDYYHRKGVFNVNFLEEDFVKSEIEADHLSIRLTYSTYKNWQKSGLLNETQLQVANLTTGQIFFLSYAQTWCRTLQPKDWMELSPDYDFGHPSKQRINDALRNIPEFSEEFNCPVGSSMNPLKKCLTW